MTDLPKSNDQNDSRFNVYFQNKRIREHLIKAGLIDLYGVILPPVPKKARSSTRVSRQQTRDKAIENAGKEKHRREADILTKEKPKKSKGSDRTPPRSLSAIIHPPSTITNRKSSPRRLKSAYHSKKEIKTSPNEDHCQVEMIYYGSQTNLDYDHSWCQPNGDEIVVSQQHCGGENLIVFKDFVKPNEKFTFKSHRHEDYPFGLALYINGLVSGRISVCCEYRHKHNVPFDGDQGLFGIVSVRGGKSCPKCQNKRKKKKKKCKSSVQLNPNPSRYQKSILPRVPSSSSSRSSEHRPRTPSPPRHRLSIKRRSPDIARTPTPPTADNRRVSSTSASASNKPIALIDHNSKIQKTVTLQDNDENNYSSDFDESDEGLPESSTLRSDEPHLSDSRLIRNQRSGLRSSESSSDNDRAKTQNGKNETAGLVKKSDPIDEKNTNQSSKVLPNGDNKGVHRSLSSSSSISDRSASSHKRATVEKNDNEQSRFSSTVRPKTAGRDRLSSSSSIERAFRATSVKTNGDNQHSTGTGVDSGRPVPSAADVFFGVERSSSNQRPTTPSYSRFERAKKADPETRSWFEDDNSDNNN